METAANSPAGRPGDRPPGRPRKNPQHSRITNGSALLPGVDGRSPWVRRCKDLIASHLADLGGVANTTAAEQSIVRRAAVLTVELEMLEVRFATAGEADSADLDLYSRASANLKRLLEAVGIQRRPRDVTTLDAEALPFSPLRARHVDGASTK